MSVVGLVCLLAALQSPGSDSLRLLALSLPPASLVLEVRGRPLTVREAVNESLRRGELDAAGKIAAAYAIAQRQRARVVLARGREVAPLLARARERSDGVCLDAQVSDRRRERTRSFEINAGAVDLPVLEQPCADVAQQRRHPRRIAVRRRAPEGALPHHDCRVRSICSERFDARPAHAIHRDLRRLAHRRPRREARDLTHEK